MKSDSQFVRWGIPGWTLILAIVFFSFLDNKSALSASLTNLLQLNTKDENFWAIFFVGVMTVGAGIPLGYIIYQIYFYLRWVSPISRDGFLPPLLTGRMKEMEASLKNIEKKKLGFGKSWREEIIEDTGDHRTFWYYINPLIHQIITEIDTKDVYYKHMSYLKEALHSLGATSLSFLIGYIVYISLKLSNQELDGFLLPMVAVFGAINFFCLYFGDQYRLKQKEEQVHYTDILAELFTSMLVFVFATLNPFVSIKGVNLQIAIFLFILGSGWALTSKDDNYAIGISLILAAGVSAYIYNSGYVFNDNQWSVFFSIIIFNVITIAFAKTRRNTIESLTAYQHYIINIYADKNSIDIYKNKDQA